MSIIQSSQINYQNLGSHPNSANCSFRILITANTQVQACQRTKVNASLNFSKHSTNKQEQLKYVTRNIEKSERHNYIQAKTFIGHKSEADTPLMGQPRIDSKIHQNLQYIPVSMDSIENPSKSTCNHSKSIQKSIENHVNPSKILSNQKRTQ